MLIKWHRSDSKSTPHPRPLSRKGRGEKDRAHFAQEIAQVRRRFADKMAASMAAAILALFDFAGGCHFGFFWGGPQKTPSRSRDRKSPECPSTLSTRHKLASARNFQTLRCPAESLGRELPVDFFPVVPKKGGPFLAPQKSQKSPLSANQPNPPKSANSLESVPSD
jgi:hypothetical protein